MSPRSLRTLLGVGDALIIGTFAVAAAIAFAAHRPEADRLGAIALVGGIFGGALGWGLRRLVLRRLDAVLNEQQAENLRFHTAIDNISQGLCFFDGRQRLIVCNARYADLYGLSADQVRPGTTLREIVDHRYRAESFPDMSAADYLAWRDKVAVSDRPSDTVTMLKNGRVIAIHHQPMPDGGWVATHEDITERRRAQAQIEQMAHSDALTGLANRVQFRDRLSALLQRAPTPASVAVLFIDLDRFKAVNDTLGHPVGDQLLCAAARRLTQCVRQQDLVARLGGDEFAIIQAGAPQPAAARSLAERLVREFAQPFVVGTHQVRVGSSIGVALSPEDGVDPDELLKKADLALYEAKAAGRGTHSFFLAEMDEQAQSRRALEIDLRAAAARGELELHYQPIMALATNRVLGFEALLRWRHPERGLVLPEHFIGLAEETGLIDALGDWVLREAFRAAMQWPAHYSIAVNLSPVQIKNTSLPQRLAAAVLESGIEPGRVELEITESVRLAEDAASLAQMHALHALGLRICLDDFGVGYSSLSYLRSFPFKKIKIDRSFVRDVADSPEAAAIVRAITALGSGLGMAITAEGVQEHRQLERLRELGCGEAQGELFGAPQPAAELSAFLHDTRHLRVVAGRG